MKLTRTQRRARRLAAKIAENERKRAVAKLGRVEWRPGIRLYEQGLADAGLA